MLRFSFLTAVAIHTIFAGILCFIPLFNLLGYEFSFAVNLLTAVTSPVIGFHISKVEPKLTRAISVSLLASIAQLIPSLFFISINAFRVRNCDLGMGLQFFLLLPTITALYGASLGLAANRILPQSARFIRIFSLLAIISFPIVWCFWELYKQPPIFVYDHLWGYFSGSLYDEGIRPNQKLFLFRAVTLFRIASILLVTALVDGSIEIMKHRYFSKKVFPLCLLFAMIFAETILGPKWGFRINRTDILNTLSVTEERPGIVIHFPPSITAEKREAIVDDHEFRLEQLSSSLQLSKLELLSNPIHSFVYHSANQKRTLMGGHRTMITKPWLNEIHIHGDNVPHKVLPHELVHVLASHFGSSLLKVSARSEIFVNLALVEGLAEALSPSTTDLDLDTYTQAMRYLKLAPDLQTLLTPTGFWTQSARRAYTIAGSFVQYLIAEYGIGRFKQAYPQGDFKKAYGRPLSVLIAKWENHIDSIELPSNYKRATQDRFRKPSIFQKPCAHVVSDLRQKAIISSPKEAIKLYKTISNYLNNSPSSLLQLAEANLRAGKKEDFQALSRNLLDEGGLTKYQQAKIMDLRGMYFWESGQTHKAREAFKKSANIRITPSFKRLQWIRLWALDQPRNLQDFIRLYLSQKVSNVSLAVELKEQIHANPLQPTLPYLLGRKLHQMKNDRKAIQYLNLAENHPSPEIEAERIRLIANSQFQLKNYPKALKGYQNYTQIAPTSGEKSRALDWIERTKWKLQNQR